MDQLTPGSRVVVNNGTITSVALIEDVRPTAEMSDADQETLRELGATRAAVLSYYILPCRRDAYNAVEIDGVWYDSRGGRLDLETLIPA